MADKPPVSMGMKLTILWVFAIGNIFILQTLLGIYNHVTEKDVKRGMVGSFEKQQAVKMRGSWYRCFKVPIPKDGDKSYDFSK